MYFGTQAVQQNVRFTDLLGFWRFLDEETAIESVWTMDHLVTPMEDTLSDLPCFESYMLLAAAAQATRRLRLGCLVTANTFRPPGLLAKMAVTLDHVSEGRFILALGAGWHEAEHRAFGIPLPPVRERLERLEEAAALLRAVLTEVRPVNYRGHYYQLQDAPFAPGFVQRPHPPLMIGGGGERRTLRTVARHADIANVMGPVSEVRHKLAVLAKHCEREGRDYDAIQKTVHAPVVAIEDSAALRVVQTFVKEHFGWSDAQMRDEVPVGTADHVRQVVERYAQLGVTGIIFPAPGPWNHDAFRYLDAEVIRPLATAA